MSRDVVLSLLCAALVSASAHSQDSATSSALPSINIERFLPVHTPAMHPGPFEGRRRQTGVSRPFFVIGCDEYSLAWLQKNHERLRQLKAFGLVVEAEDAPAYRRLETEAEGLLVGPVAGDLIAEHLGVKQYPALITSDGVFP